jgi:hypothetical protein
LLTAGLATAQAIAKDWYRAYAFASLAPQLIAAGDDGAALAALADIVAATYRTFERTDALSFAAVVCANLAQLYGPDASTAVFAAILDIVIQGAWP